MKSEDISNVENLILTTLKKAADEGEANSEDSTFHCLRPV